MPLIVVSLVLMPFGLEGAVVPLLGIGNDLIIAVATGCRRGPGPA
jgi:hypothetical protein